MSSNYMCRGQIFLSQRAADEARRLAQVATRHQLTLFVCLDGHWHYGRA